MHSAWMRLNVEVSQSRHVGGKADLFGKKKALDFSETLSH